LERAFKYPACRGLRMPRIPVIHPDEATGELKAVYDDVQQRRGAVANVLRIQSLHPETLRTHLDMYMSILYGRSGLSRAERETIAVAVSAANGCKYCVKHHADALSKYQKDKAIVAALAEGQQPVLGTRESALVAFARQVTLQPASMADSHVQLLRDAGLNDEEILMATLTAAYFNFVNRVVHTLGVDLEAHEAVYKY
jgi:uncharacterized peroxidase-related enzyme